MKSISSVNFLERGKGNFIYEAFFPLLAMLLLLIINQAAPYVQ